MDLYKQVLPLSTSTENYLFLGSSLFKLNDNKSAKCIPQKSDDNYDHLLYM